MEGTASREGIGKRKKGERKRRILGKEEGK